MEKRPFPKSSPEEEKELEYDEGDEFLENLFEDEEA